jgi:hypothetical protein
MLPSDVQDYCDKPFSKASLAYDYFPPYPVGSEHQVRIFNIYGIDMNVAL